MMTRRTFLRGTVIGGAACACGGAAWASSPASGISISLAQWSLHTAIFSGEMSAMDFAVVARERFGIDAIEYVNQFYREQVGSPDFGRDLRRRADDNGVSSLLIMVDREGSLGAGESSERLQVVENHLKWLELAAVLGCHSIRVNAAGPGGREALHSQVVDGLSRLCERARDFSLNVLVENHGGLSSDGAWLARVIADVGMDNCGTLPDFGNFCIRRETAPDGSRTCAEEYDRYRGVAELMPFAKAVSAKSYAFAEDGSEITIDYPRMMQLVVNAGYRGHVGIEYEGKTHSEEEGILKTKALLTQILNPKLKS